MSRERCRGVRNASRHMSEMRCSNSGLANIACIGLLGASTTGLCGDEAVIAIATGEVIAGSLPGRALRLVREWTLMHGDELNANWDLARARRTLAAIAPLR
jgi:hypothetical protein